MQSDFVQTGSTRLQYFEHGSGPETVVLVHGYTASARIWRAMQERLDPTRFRVLAFNNRGAGDSDRSVDEADYTVEAFAHDLSGAVTTLGLRDFHLVGHSMGGATVSRFALDHQALLKSLTLLDPAPLASRPALTPGWDDEIRARFRTGETPRSTSGAAAPATRHEALPEHYRRELAEDVARTPLERLIGSRRSMASLDLRSRLGEIRVPTLVIGGDLDTTVGVPHILAEYLALPEAHRFLHVYHRVGHSPNIDLPGEMAALLTEFFTVTVPGFARP